MIDEDKLKKARTLAVIEEEMTKAEKALEDADRRLSIARSDETSARNRLNNLQKELDDRIAERKKSAPRDTDWANSKRNWVGADTVFGEGVSIKGGK